MGTHLVHQPGHHLFTIQPLNLHMQALLFFNHLSMAEPVIQEARPKPESTSPAENSIRSSPSHYSELALQSQTRLWWRGVGTGRLWTRGRGSDRPTGETSSPSAPSTRAVCRSTRGSIGTEATRPSPAVLREGIESNVASMRKWDTQCVLYLLEREKNEESSLYEQQSKEEEERRSRGEEGGPPSRWDASQPEHSRAALIRECGTALGAGGKVDLTAALADERLDVDVTRDVAVLEHHVGVEGQQVALELYVESANGWLASR